MEPESNVKTPSGGQPPLARPFDVFWAVLFLAFWLLPIFYVGFFKRSFPLQKLEVLGLPSHAAEQVHKFANNNYRIACLFTDRVEGWGHYYFQARLVGQRQWINLDDSDYALLKPFGYRTRLHRMLSQTSITPAGDPRRQSIAEFVKQRFETLYPEEGKIEAVRVLRAGFKSGDPAIALPAGHWAKPPLFIIPSHHYKLMFEHQFPDHSEYSAQEN